MDAHHQIIIIGGGQAGLSAGLLLRDTGDDFVIVDAETHPGDQWRRRWDSLSLFTPVRYSELKNTPWPFSAGHLPSREETAEYLAACSAGLPVRSGTTVTGVRLSGGLFHIDTYRGSLTADAVIVATGATSTPFVPAFAEDLAPEIHQLHSDAYRNADSVTAQRVLVVGFGTSGAEIARELAEAGRDVIISGRHTPVIPHAVTAYAGALWWLVPSRLLCRSTPIGRKAAADPGRGAPLLRGSPTQLRAAGVVTRGRVDGAVDGHPLIEGAPVDVDAVVWCTGYRGSFDWIRIPGLQVDEHGYPIAPYGRAADVPRLEFMGMPLQSCVASTLLGGVSRDAAQVVGSIRSQLEVSAHLAA